MRRSLAKFGLLLSASALLMTCADGADEDSGFNPSCSLSSSSWTPNISGLSASNHDSGSISVAPTAFTGTAPVVGLDQSYSSGNLIEINFTVGSLGPNGSISFVGETTSFPSELEGSAYPVLISLENTTAGDGDMVKLSSNCASNGLFSCSGGSCGAEASCTLASDSIFKSRGHWQQYQIPPFGNTSMNVVPTCNWDNTTYSGFQCAFNNSYMNNGATPDTATLKTGNYRAKFLLVATRYASLPSASASFRITVTLKTDTRAVADYNNNSNGAVDLNVILVGSKNVTDSKTTKGKANLDALFRRVYDHFNQDGDFPIAFATPAPTTVYGGVGLQIGEINVFEMGCEDSDDLEYFANIPASALGDLFRVGTALLPSSTEGKALNIFLTSFIDNDITESGTILGVSGGIGGPPINGTEGSGLVFRSADRLATFNPSCGSASTCPDLSHEADFVDMAGTISHEMGHFLGLNHLTEQEGTANDPLADTPTCPASGGSVSHTSCKNAAPCSAVCSTYSSSNPATWCPTEPDCQFNHIMWYTTKNYSTAVQTGDAFMFSDHSSRILNYSPFVR